MLDILYITHRVPYPLDKGDRIRCANILTLLSNYARLDLVSLMDESLHPLAPGFLTQYTRTYHLIPINGWSRYLRMLAAPFVGQPLTLASFAAPFLTKLLTSLLSRHSYDAILISHTALFPLLPTHGKKTSIIVDMMDVDSRKWREFSCRSRWLAFLYRRESTLIAELERLVLQKADAVCLTTEREREYLRGAGAEDKIIVAGNGVNADYYRISSPPSKKVSELVFFGALDYWPNIDAILWFASEVMPRVRHLSFSYRLHIAGRKPHRAVQKLACSNDVILHPNPPDIRPIVNQCGVGVFPLRMVMGIPNKVLEAMALARACIVSPQIHQVIGGCPGVHYLVAGDALDWAQNIALLTRNPYLANTIGSNARQFVKNTYQWDAQLSPLLRRICFRAISCEKILQQS